MHPLIRGSDRKTSLQNPGFCAGLELAAFGQELPGFHGFLEKGFGRDHCRNVLEKAAAHYEQAVELDPGRIYHHLELAEIYADRKRTADANAQLRLVDSLPVREAMDSAYKREGASLMRRLAKH